MDSGGGNTGSSDPAKTSTVETATNSLPGCGCSSANNITVRVTPTTGGQFDLQVAKTESVENFKKLISKKLKVPKERICLLHRDRQLREGTLQENQLMDGSRLTLLPSVETGLLIPFPRLRGWNLKAQRPEQSVMQALESLNDTQVNDFLSGKAPLNLTMRLGDHMMLIQLQLSTVTPSSSRRSSGGSSNTTTTTTATSSSTTSTSSTSAPAASTSAAAATTSAPSPAAAASSFTASPSPSASLSKSYVGGAGLPAQLSPTLAAPSLSSVIASSPSLSSVIAAAAASAAASAAAAAAAASSSGSGSSSAGSTSGMGEPMMTNSRTALPPSIPSSSVFAKAPVAAPVAAAAASTPRSSTSSFTTATTTSVAECAGVHQPASPAPCPAPAASPHTSPLKFLEEAASFLPKVTSSTDCPTAASTSSPSFTSPSTATSSSSSSPPSSCPSSSSPPSSSFHTAQPSTSSSTPSTSPNPSPSSSPSSSSTTAAAAATAGGASTTHACGYGNGGSGCKCETPAAKPMLDTRALAEASRNLTQTLKQLSSEVLTSRSDAAEDSPRGGRRQGAIIESMHHHGKGVYSGTFSGTLNPALQDRYGRPKRDISTIIHILNDLLCATPQYRRHTRQGHSISVEATGSTVPKKGTNTSDKNSSSLEYMEESGSLSRENQATRGKMEHLRLIMEERRARRRARREARAAPYTTQWSAKSESLPQSSAMGHDTVEPMETGEQSSSTASSEQQLCELNPPEPVVA